MSILDRQAGDRIKLNAAKISNWASKRRKLARPSRKGSGEISLNNKSADKSEDKIS